MEKKNNCKEMSTHTHTQSFGVQDQNYMVLLFINLCVLNKLLNYCVPHISQ